MQVFSNSDLDADIMDWPVHMRHALQLAHRVISAAPNPRVGCVLVKDGQVVGEGWHSAAGQAHAEVEALQRAGAEAAGATAFVTLEPCAHTGRTGPCATALLAAGVSRVVVAGVDPNPAVSGKGIAQLEAAGVTVAQLSDFAADAELLNAGYFRRRRLGRPLVRCKLAMSLDGRTALANGASKWITGVAARADVQLLRARSCAILTGIGTVLADDPALTVRQAELPLTASELADNTRALARQPLRIILDNQLRTPPAAAVLRGDNQAVIYTRQTATAAHSFPANVAVHTLPDLAPEELLGSVLESLAAEYECNEVLIEAGATLSTAFLEASLVDELVLYIAPKLLGSDARALVDLAGLHSLSEARGFSIVDLAMIGEDIRVTLVPLSANGN